MKIYYFGGRIDQLDVVKNHEFDGALFTSGVRNPNLVNITSYLSNSEKIQSKCIRCGITTKNLMPTKNFKYMIAIRPYQISPQYLTMLCNSIDEVSPDKIEVNLISGWTEEFEKEYGGVVSDVNDFSSSIEKSNYLIKFLEVFSQMKVLKPPQIFVSTTNQFTFSAAKSHGYDVILPYSRYITGEYDIDKPKTMVSVGPIIREEGEAIGVDMSNVSSDCKVFTKEELIQFLDDLKEQNVKGVLFFPYPFETENDRILSFVKEYKNK
jgi:hypothetical protein